MKALPSRVAERLTESGEPLRRHKVRRFRPRMLEELMHISGEPGDAAAILMMASLVRDDLPWLYELAMEVYRAAKRGDLESIERVMARVHRFMSVVQRGLFIEVFTCGSEESRWSPWNFRGCWSTY